MITRSGTDKELKETLQNQWIIADLLRLGLEKIPIAEIAMYRAKEQGKNKFELFTSTIYSVSRGNRIDCSPPFVRYWDMPIEKSISCLTLTELMQTDTRWIRWK